MAASSQTRITIGGAPSKELGCVSAIDSNGRTIGIADAHRDDGKRFVVYADGKLTTFLELESAICDDQPAGLKPLGDIPG